jgi:hypothetical protein
MSRRNPFGWDYPPGAEFDPRAPWNEKELVCKQCLRVVSNCICQICPKCQNYPNDDCYFEPDANNCGGLWFDNVSDLN